MCLGEEKENNDESGEMMAAPTNTAVFHFSISRSAINEFMGISRRPLSVTGRALKAIGFVHNQIQSIKIRRSNFLIPNQMQRKHNRNTSTAKKSIHQKKNILLLPKDRLLPVSIYLSLSNHCPKIITSELCRRNQLNKKARKFL